MVRTPTLAELSLDLSAELQTFKDSLGALTRCGYAVAVGGSRARISGTVSGDYQAARRFTTWVQDRLSEPRLAFRSPLRQALMLAAAHSNEFESLDVRDRPDDECFYILLAKHELVSMAARKAVLSGCGSLAEWWNKFDDTVAMLELMSLLLYPDEQLKHAVRCFAARCRQLDSSCNDLVFRLDQFAITPKWDDVPGFASGLETEFRPVIDLCDPTICWDELCSVTQRLCRQLLIGRNAGRAQLANTMRRWIENPWL
jgi:hypothetical protein